jgi:hypothetical protein
VMIAQAFKQRGLRWSGLRMGGKIAAQEQCSQAESRQGILPAP